MKGQENSSYKQEEALEEDLIRVQSVQQELRSVVHSTYNHAHHTDYTIRTTDRDGNTWECHSRYSAVVRLLEELKQKRDIGELPVMPRKRWFHSFQGAVIWERRAALNAVLAALVPRHAGIPEVRLFLRLDDERLDDERLLQREAEEAKRKEEKMKEDLSRAKAVGLPVDGGVLLSQEALREVARREAMEPMTVKCLLVHANETVCITVKGWQRIEASVHAAIVCVTEVLFGGITVDSAESFDDLGIERDATLSVLTDEQMKADRCTAEALVKLERVFGFSTMARYFRRTETSVSFVESDRRDIDFYTLPEVPPSFSTDFILPAPSLFSLIITTSLLVFYRSSGSFCSAIQICRSSAWITGIS